MDDFTVNEIETASSSVVLQAAHDFAAALAETTQFIAFETAAYHLNKDLDARQAIEAFQAKQKSLQVLLKLNAVSPDELAELERLRQDYWSMLSVKAYIVAEENLTSICQVAADLISKSTGFDYATACGRRCCG